MNKHRDCDTLECDKPVRPLSKGNLCPTCLANAAGWRKRPAQLIKYRRKLTKYAYRADRVLENVRVLRRKRG